MSNFAVSVIVCSHNPNPIFLNRCIAGLQSQSLSTMNWELIVVDNASDPEKAPRPDLAWHPNSSLIYEGKIGLTPARVKGIRSSIGELIVFVDDDNVLDPNFLEVALHIQSANAFLGAWSGTCIPEFEETPPEWTRRYWGCLAIKDIQKNVWSNEPRNASCLPCGAGMCARRSVAIRYCEKIDKGERQFQLDRTGTVLLSGGDHDLAGCSVELGLGFGVMTGLRLTHIMPKWRLTLEYLTKLMEGIHFSGVILDSMHGILPLRRRNWLNHGIDAIRILRTKGPHRYILKACYRGRNRAEKLVLKTR